MTRRGETLFDFIFMMFVVVVLALGVWGLIYVVKRQIDMREQWTAAMTFINPATATIGQKVYLGTDLNSRSGVVLGIEPGGAEKPAKIRVRLPPLERSQSSTDYTEATFLPTELWVHQ